MSLNRRQMARAGAVSIVALAVPGGIAAQDGDASSAGIVAGGGAVETPLGLVDFGLTARVGADGAAVGALSLSDLTQPGNPTILRSKQLNRLEAHDEAQPNARQIVGWATASGQTAPFVPRVSDAGGPGSGKDTFSFYIGEAAAPYLESEEQAICDCADYSYQLEGTVVRGDIMVVAG